ncbi:hypothetical protein [Nitrospira sp. Ecomares 2.1]
MEGDDLFHFLDYPKVSINDKDFDKFSNAIISFWRDAPEKTPPIPFDEITTRTPEWFWKAIKKDSPTKKTKKIVEGSFFIKL